MEGPKQKSRWPKGPFPDKWSFAHVAQRLEGAWATRSAAWDALMVSGAEPLPPLDDLYVRVFRSSDGEAIAALREAGCTVHGWSEPAASEPTEGAFVALPTADRFDALVALGVAGPHWGIGNRAVIRFLIQARAFASFEVLAGGEDLLVLRMLAKNRDDADLLSQRLVQLVPLLARETDVFERLIEGTPIALSWAPR
jgi:hypothetical protein